MVISWMLIKDPFSPICIVCEVFTVSSYFATISAELRDVDISIGTVVYILIQLSIALILATIMHRLSGRITQVKQFERIELIKYRYFLILIVICLLTVLYIVIFGRSILASSGGGFAEKLYSFRQSTITGSSPVPAYVIYLTKGIYAFAYYSIFIYFHNREASRCTGVSVQSDRLYLFSVLPLLVVALLSGGRAEIIYFICAVLSYYSILRSKTLTKAIPIKNILRIAVYFLLTLFAFYQLSFLFGRGGKTLTSYLASYFGGSIIAFDQFLINPVPNSDVWGMELFYSIVHFLQKIGFVGGDIILVHLDYVYINGSAFTNVYTCFRAYVIDAGLYSSFLIHLLFIYFYEKYYIRILKRDSIYDKVNMSIIIYGLISYGVYLTFYSNYLFALVLSIHTLIQIVLIIFYNWFTTSPDFKIRLNFKIRL